MASIANLVRSEGDPKIVKSGPSSVYPEDRVAKSLGWFSIGLGIVQILAPSRLTRLLGLQGAERVVQAFGMREIASGLATLSPDRKAGLWSRVAGDGLDIGFLLRGVTPENPKRENVKAALFAVAGVAALDVLTALAVSSRQRRAIPKRLYHDRTGFPGGFSLVLNKPRPTERSSTN